MAREKGTFKLSGVVHGWASIEIEGNMFEQNEQFKINIPVSTWMTAFIKELLMCLLDTVEKNKATVLFIDGEGEDTHIIFEPLNIIVIKEAKKRECFFIDNLDAETVAASVIESLDTNLENYLQDIKNDCLDDSEKESADKEIEIVKNLYQRLKLAIDKKEADKELNREEKNWLLTLELNGKQLFALLKALDISSRLAAGQWSELQRFANENKDDDGNPMSDYIFMDRDIEHKLYKIRNEVMPWFENKGFHDHANLGIYSKHLSENAKIQYDIYKHIMYQRNKEMNIDNVYSYEPLDASEDGAPKIVLYWD